MNEWQDISTAPKTSRAILVWVPENKCTFAVSWNSTWGDDIGCWEIFGGNRRDFLQRASHWQPLPPAPKENPNE